MPGIRTLFFLALTFAIIIHGRIPDKKEFFVLLKHHISKFQNARNRDISSKKFSLFLHSCIGTTPYTYFVIVSTDRKNPKFGRGGGGVHQLGNLERRDGWFFADRPVVLKKPVVNYLNPLFRSCPCDALLSGVVHLLRCPYACGMTPGAKQQLGKGLCVPPTPPVNKYRLAMPLIVASRHRYCS